MIIDFSNKELYNEKYIKILNNDKRYIFLCGGAGSGKSVFQAQKEVIKTFGKNKLMIIRKVKDTHKDSTFAEIKNIINQWSLSEYFDFTVSPLGIVNKLTGSSIIFRGMDDPEKIKSVQGINRIWIEEATELEEDDFNQLDLRLRGQKNMQISCTFNPINSEHWLNTKFWQLGNTDDVELLHTTYLDNRFVGDKFKTVIERLKNQNPTYYKIYALGEWGILEGLVFEVQPIIVNDFEDNLICYGQDFGYTNDPTALVALHKYQDGILLDELIYRTGMTNQDIISSYKDLGVDKYANNWADSSEPKSIEEIYRSGYNIKPVKKGPDSIMFGIDTMKQHKLYISSRSVNGIKEFKSYVWNKDKAGKFVNKPIDFNNHFLDAARYAFMSEFGNKIDYNIVIG